MNKEIICGESAQELIKSVVDKLCDMVSITLGPKGKNAIIDTDYTEPFITNDGVTIAKNIEFSPREEVIAKIIKEASIKTCDKVGDGTTTSLTILKSLYDECYEYMLKGVSPYVLKEGLNKSINNICDYLLKKSRIPNSNDIKNIATVSSGSKEYGEMISKIIDKNKNNGKIIIEESSEEKTYVKYIKGMFVESNLASSYMLKKRLPSEDIDEPYYLITDEKIEDSNDLLEIINSLRGKNLIIIADAFSEEVINYLCALKENNILNVVALEAPNYGENKIDTLEDICIYTSSKLISSKKGIIINEVSINDLGHSKSILVNRNNIIINGSVNNYVKNRIKYLNKLLEKETDEFQKDVLTNRISYLSSLTSIIYVGAKTKSEMILNKMRLEDAVYASRMALKYGFSLGGGKEFYNISKTLGNSISDKILKKVLVSPLQKIISNACENYDDIISKIGDNKELGYDAYVGKIVNLLEEGIIDPTIILIEELKNAFSISSILLTTSLIVVTSEKKEVKNITEVL